MPFVFYTLPDGKHIIAGDDLMPFGEHPFTEIPRNVAGRARTVPIAVQPPRIWRLVEFADFQCPHCKEAQANMDKLAVDFPKARIVFQNMPLPQHSAAMGAAEYGVCVNKLGGSDAFFTFASAVFDGQDGLATADGATLTLNSAVTKAGLDPAKVSACASAPETKAAVDASVKLAQDIEDQPDSHIDDQWPPSACNRSLRDPQADRPVPVQGRRRSTPVRRQPPNHGKGTGDPYTKQSHRDRLA